MTSAQNNRSPHRIAAAAEIQEGLTRLIVNDTELVVVSANDTVSVFSGECLHEGALMADGYIEGHFLFCSKHLWRYNLETGELDKEPGVGLKKLNLWQENGEYFIDLNEVNELTEPEDEFNPGFFGFFIEFKCFMH